MVVLLLIPLPVIFVCVALCASVKYLFEATNYSLSKKERVKPVVRLYKYSLDFAIIFWELLFITFLFLALYSGFVFQMLPVFSFSVFFAFFALEIIPKYLVRYFYELSSSDKREKAALISSVFFKLSFLALPPEIKKIIKENSRFDSYFNNQSNKVVRSQAMENEGVDEQEIIDKVFELGDQSVYEAMRPRTEITGVDIHDSIDEVHQKFVNTGYSKLVVYEDNFDNIKGVVFAYDLFKFPDDLKSIIRPIIFVPENKKSIEMLNLFLNNHVSIAVVVDEFGGTSGIVTTEDIIEELFGEIKDEYDVEENICKKVSENSFVLSGKVEIDFLNENYELNIPEGEYETIGGLIITHSGKIPLKGEIVKIGRFAFNIIRATNRKIDLVKMIVASSYKQK